MALVHGPLMSLDASGTIGKAITYTKWKGRNVVRERVIPANPKSGAQVGRRAMFAFLTQNWAGLTAAEKASWQDLADQLVASPFNAYIKDNMEYWHNALSPSQNSSRAAANNGSDRDLTAAVWEENRIKISSTATAANEQWGCAYYASTGTPVGGAISNVIRIELDEDILARDTFWTPPSVVTWYINIKTFSDDGIIETFGTEQTAIP